MLVDLVTVRTADGVRLDGAFAGPPEAFSGVLAVHGAFGNFYTGPPSELLHSAPPRGHVVLSMNLRSHDLGTAGDGEPCIGFVRDRFDQCRHDFDAATAQLRIRADRYAIVVHSFHCHKVLAWLATEPAVPPYAVVLLSPGPHPRSLQKWLLDKPLDDFLRTARDHVEAGRPDHLMVLTAKSDAPMVAEAQTVLSTFGWDFEAEGLRVAGELDIPALVTCGSREIPIYRDYAAKMAGTLPAGELVELDDTHSYDQDREALSRTVLDWLEIKKRS